LSLARSVAWNTALQVGGRIAGLLLSMFLTAILTRHLGLNAFGQMVAATTYVGLFTVLGDAGIYLVAVRRAAQEPARRAVLLGNALALRLTVALVPLGLAWVLVQFVPASRFPTYVPAVKLAVAILALNGYLILLNQFLIAVFRLHLRMDLAVLGEMLARVVALGATLLVVALDGGLLAVVAALTAGTLANFLFAWTVARRFERFRPRFDGPLLGDMLRESMVLAVVTLLGLVHFKVDTLLLSVLRSAEDVGVYGVAYRLHEVLVTFPGLFVGLLYPLFARFATEDPVRLRQVFQRAFDVLLLASVAAGLLVWVLAPHLAVILGAEDAARPMRILAFALPPVFVGLGFTHLLLAESRQKWLVQLYALLVLANVAGNWLAIQRWSYLGAAAMTVGTESLALAVLLVYWLGRRRWRLSLRSALGVPLALGIAALVAPWVPAASAPLDLAARCLHLVVAGTVTLALFAGGVLGLRILPLAAIRALLPGGGRASEEAF
jgi:O-antigen/teichoic acid export membrane protein